MKNITKILIFTEGIIDQNYEKHPSFWRLFPYWIIDEESA